MVAFYRWALHDLLYHGIPMGATLSVASCGLLPVGSAWSHHSWYTHGDTSHNGIPTPIACLVITNPCGRKIRFRACQVAWKAAGRGQSNTMRSRALPHPKPRSASHDWWWHVGWFYMYHNIIVFKTCSWSTIELYGAGPGSTASISLYLASLIVLRIDHFNLFILIFLSIQYDQILASFKI